MSEQLNDMREQLLIINSGSGAEDKPKWRGPFEYEDKIEGIKREKLRDSSLSPEQQFSREALIRIQNACHFTNQVFPEAIPTIEDAQSEADSIIAKDPRKI